MDQTKITEKIKKCLALSESANEYEAAQALRHAQRLMEKYDIDMIDISLSNISETSAKQKLSQKLANWKWEIAYYCAKAFNCKYFVSGSNMIFVGFGNKSELASYAFDVVYRQMVIARKKYLRNCKIENTTERQFCANNYCSGWLRTAGEKLKKYHKVLKMMT